MPESATAAEIRDVNTRYHDAAAGDYDFKWGINFGPVGRRQVTIKLAKALGFAPAPFERALEVGAGTGYFTLNLVAAGVVRRAVCSDISPRMLDVLAANARRLGLEVETVLGDAERLELPDQSFDLVFGHAVLHHLPDLPAAFRAFHRLLRPGGRLAFAGEPSRHGDRLAALPKRGALALAPLWRAAMSAPAANGEAEGGDHGMEWLVDVHSFSPAELRSVAREAGFDRVRVGGEELLASWFGWANRTLEGTVDPDRIPWLWRQYAYRGYLALQQVDHRLLEGRLPSAWFYNLLLSAQKPERFAPSRD
jgi:ubiquinone/menaquinone biosynthesis C-methylase UbiE